MLHKKKQLEKGDAWRKMWFVVNDHVLYTYKAPADAIAGDSQPLLGYDFDLDVAVSLITSYTYLYLIYMLILDQY